MFTKKEIEVIKLLCEMQIKSAEEALPFRRILDNVLEKQPNENLWTSKETINWININKKIIKKLEQG